ncbi:hypothetical protein Ciccas_014010 [Cichlidogyrus casuarinus]|uniref:Uncharacterized protein n=1 Tax=Cichlidogyrus casuarinus TaxID=1844966 RepID=A0ABD2PJQ6_9PLAT
MVVFYCLLQTTSSDKVRDLSRIMRNRLRSKDKFRQVNVQQQPPELRSITPSSEQVGGRASASIEYQLNTMPPAMGQNQRAYSQDLHSDMSRMAGQLAKVESNHLNNVPRNPLPPRRAASAMARPLIHTLDSNRNHLSTIDRSSFIRDEEHMLIAQYSHALRRSIPDLVSLICPLVTSSLPSLKQNFFMTMSLM